MHDSLETHIHGVESITYSTIERELEYTGEVYQRTLMTIKTDTLTYSIMLFHHNGADYGPELVPDPHAEL